VFSADVADVAGLADGTGDWFFVAAFIFLY
jgi:hypothetical protein